METEQVHLELVQQLYNEWIHDEVVVWSKFRSTGKYRKRSMFNSEAELLTAHGLPKEVTLAEWTILVELLDKETFAEIGVEALSYMVRTVALYQPDARLRKRDYKNLLAGYCTEQTVFDKAAFYEEVRAYVQTTYIDPADKTDVVRGDAEIEVPTKTRRRRGGHGC